MSAAAERPPERPRTGLPPQWARLERAAEEAAVAVGVWKQRAAEAEEEVLRLRRALEEVAAPTGAADDPSDAGREVRRLRAENAALSSRMLQARKRIATLLERLDSLGIEW